jgi:hypothetical protein
MQSNLVVSTPLVFVQRAAGTHDGRVLRERRSEAIGRQELPVARKQSLECLGE